MKTSTPYFQRLYKSANQICLVGIFMIGSTFAHAQPTEVFSAGFESPTYTIGDLNGQEGWFAQFGNFQVSTNDPANGDQHVEVVSDGLGQTFSLTQSFPAGMNLTENITTVKANIKISALGVTWEFIPQDPAVSLVISRIRFNPDGTVSALDMTTGNYEPTGATFPVGTYFEAKMTVDRAAQTFKFFIDNTMVYMGSGFAMNVENIAFLSLMEPGTAGITMNFDDVLLLDGEEEVEIPTVGQWGLFVLSMLIMTLGVVTIKNNQVVTSA